jgi:hypothetical protein
VGAVTGNDEHRPLLFRRFGLFDAACDLLGARDHLFNGGHGADTVQRIMVAVIGDAKPGQLLEQFGGNRIGRFDRKAQHLLLHIVLICFVSQLQGLIHGIKALPALSAVEVGSLQGDASLQGVQGFAVDAVPLKAFAAVRTRGQFLLLIRSGELIGHLLQAAAQERGAGLHELLAHLPQRWNGSGDEHRVLLINPLIDLPIRVGAEGFPEGFLVRR